MHAHTVTNIYTVSHTYKPYFIVPLDKRSNIVAIVGGFFGGLVVLGFVLSFSIQAAMALIFSKQGVLAELLVKLMINVLR